MRRGMGTGGRSGRRRGVPAGRFGSALSFNGSGARVTVPDSASLDLTTGMTLEAWVFPTAGGSAWRDVIYKGQDDIYYLMSSSNLARPAAGGIFSGPLYGTSGLPLNVWSHLAATFDGSTLRLLVNGVQVASQPVLVPIGASNGALTIGGDALYGQHFAGRIDEVRIYNTALTASEVQADMATSIGSGGPPDTQPPTAPGTPMAAPMSGNRIDLSWDPATDDSRVTGYRVERCQGTGCSNFLQFATPAETSFSNTGLAASTTYRYQVRAVDAAGNLGPYSPVVTATTVSGASAFANDVVVQNLNFVPAMRFLPGGKKLMGEIAGTLRVVQPGATEPDGTPFLVIPNAVAEADAGLHDLTLDPNFASNRYLYVSYAHTVGNSYRDRVSRFTAAADLNTASPGSELVLWQDDAATISGAHHGASLAFGPDGKLYISTGDNGQPPDSQSLTSYHGKILRLNPDGSTPSDNPFVDGPGGNKDEIWAYGLRNPYRMTFHPTSGRLYVADVGGNTHATSVEELDLVVRGANYGWPLCDGGPCGTTGVTDPVYWYPHAGRDAAIMGGFFYAGSEFPAAFQGSYFFADYAQNWLKRLTFDATGTVVTGVFNFQPLDGTLDNGQIGDPVQLHQGPDGSLYYLDLSFDEQAGSFNAGTLRRVRFLGATNQPPAVVAAASPLGGLAPLLVSFSSDGTLDPEGDPLTYSWNFGDGATSTQPNPTHTYSASGQYTATLTVSDGTRRDSSRSRSASAIGRLAKF